MLFEMVKVTICTKSGDNVLLNLQVYCGDHWKIVFLGTNIVYIT
jgi:hypothetical protein